MFVMCAEQSRTMLSESSGCSMEFERWSDLVFCHIFFLFCAL